ncbi:DUF416 family protein [Blastopirellula retiformator]|uniref:DUF416 family protein n=1 Tax=Blastopirellula retiformator TaxID=2527970 RepID=A0A5C5V938_9BACT|nr:DUF416 family protein [Blastopirellula retiformator]TWT34791.1 hypothetical protein Enr8_22050 [Blastopirellula retiformator]
MLFFDQVELKRRLDCLSSRSRMAFALACAERLLPFYHAFSEVHANNRWSYLRSIANTSWDQLLNNVVIAKHEFLREYPSLAPNDDWPKSEFTLLDPLAENAVLALGLASECYFSEFGEPAVLAAEQAYEAVDYLAQNTECLDYRETGSEEAILKCDVVQDELKRQIDTLAMLEGTSERDVDYQSVIGLLREQAIGLEEKMKRAALSLVKAQ